MFRTQSNASQGFFRQDRLKQLRSFCHVAVHGSMSRAAQHLMLSQSAVSRQVSALENELGTRLFERCGAKTCLTREGECIYEYVMPLVQDIDRLPETFAEERLVHPVTALTIGAGLTSAAYVLPRYVTRFQERHPGARINIRTGGGSQRLNWLRGHELDVIVLSVDTAPKEFQLHEMHETGFVLITPLDHPLVGRSSLKLSDIEGHHFVGHRPGRRVRELGDAHMGKLGIKPEFVVEVDDWDDIKLYVAAGVGIAAVPEICITEHDAVWSTSLEDYLPPRRYGAVTRNDEPVSLATRQFLQIVNAEDGEAES